MISQPTPSKNLVDPSGNCPWYLGAFVDGVASGSSVYFAGGDGRAIFISAATGAIAGAASMGIGAGVGLGAGTAAFYGTPVIGRSIGVGLARTNEFWASLLTGAAIGTTIEGAGACR
jgi:hypothetical protein